MERRTFTRNSGQRRPFPRPNTRPSTREDKVIVLDFLKNGYPDDPRPFHMKEPVLQTMGKDHFVLLELIAAKDAHFDTHEELYIGEGQWDRTKVSYIKGVLPIGKLTQTARKELDFVIGDLVDANPQKFVEFFNKAGAVSLRYHQFELLPGVGKRHSEELIKARQEKPFENFEDVKKRVSSISNPRQIIIDRIIQELEGKDRYKLFVGATARTPESPGGGR